MLAWEAERHALDPLASSNYVNPESGVATFLPNIAGHRNVNVTACPGDAFSATFPTLRQQVASEIAAHTGASVDHTAPTGTLSPMLSPTGGSTMTFGLPFVEPVTGLETGDFSVGGTSAGWAVTEVSGTASTYTVTLHSDAPTDGTVVLTLPAGSVTDLAGNMGPPAPLVATATYATDTTKPTAVIWWTPHHAALNVPAFDLTVTFNEPVLGLPFAKLKLSGTSEAATPWVYSQSAMLGSGANYGFSLEAANPADGTLTVTIPAGATTDPAGNPNVATAITVVIDRTAPTTGVPGTTLRNGSGYITNLPGRVTWTGADGAGSGITSYDVERSVDGASFATLATGVTTTSLSVSLVSGHSYRYAVRAHDAAGNVGGWLAGSTTKASVRQDTSSLLHWSSGWTTVSSSNYSGGTLRYATKAGSWMSTTFAGRAIAIVTTRGSNRGQVKVYVDGAYRETVDTRLSSAVYRSIVWVGTWTSAGTHTVKLVVVGTAGRARVDVDAVLILS
jgi:hypothetical protein